MKTLPDIKDVRGMSEPFFFSFNTSKDGIMVGHAVIFTSFMVTDECQLQVGDMESDPRMQHFLYFVRSNWGTVALAESAMGLEDKIAFLKRSEARLESRIAALKQKLEEVERNIVRSKQDLKAVNHQLPQQ